MPLENIEIEELSREVNSYLQENLLQVLIKLNRSERLSEFLELIDASHLLKSGPAYNCYKNGRIIVVGQTNVSKDILEKTAKWLGISSDRFEFYLEYNNIPDLSYIKYRPDYSAILVGPMPHSIEGKGGYSSPIVYWEKEEGFPPVKRVGGNGLKITKSSFQNALQELLNQGKIVADIND